MMARAAVFVLTMLLLVSTGCQEKGVRTRYGSRSSYGASSVNGTSVFGKMFEEAGCHVHSWKMMSPTLAEADVIVWFVEDTKPPAADAAYWLDDWLHFTYNDKTYEYEDKVLIYVARGYDAEELYWRETAKLAPATLKAQFNSELLRSKSNPPGGPNKVVAGEVEEWFDIKTPKPPKPVKKFSGPWAGVADATKATAEQGGLIHPSEDAEVLLADAADNHPLVSRLDLSEENSYDSGQPTVFLVENGSFLLNAPLVKHENRKLAGRLIAEAASRGDNVVFLESDSEPMVSDKDPNPGMQTIWQVFTIWPIGVVLTQAAVLGLVYALSQFPIFGVPRRLQRASLTDFGKHVAALARLLAATHDRAYAYGLLKQYFGEKR